MFSNSRGLKKVLCRYVGEKVARYYGVTNHVFYGILAPGQQVWLYRGDITDQFEVVYDPNESVLEAQAMQPIVVATKVLELGIE